MRTSGNKYVLYSQKYKISKVPIKSSSNDQIQPGEIKHLQTDTTKNQKVILGIKKYSHRQEKENSIRGKSTNYILPQKESLS